MPGGRFIQMTKSDRWAYVRAVQPQQWSFPLCLLLFACLSVLEVQGSFAVMLSPIEGEPAARQPQQHDDDAGDESCAASGSYYTLYYNETANNNVCQHGENCKLG